MAWAVKCRKSFNTNHKRLHKRDERKPPQPHAMQRLPLDDEVIATHELITSFSFGFQDQLPSCSRVRQCGAHRSSGIEAVENGSCAYLEEPVTEFLSSFGSGEYGGQLLERSPEMILQRHGSKASNGK